jgi:hypothetical protein
LQYYFTARHSSAYPKSAKRYKEIISLLARKGHENTNYVHKAPESEKYKRTAAEARKKKRPNLDIQLENLKNSDALICDLTIPSTTVGFQISTAVNNKIPCLALIFVDDTNADTMDPIILTQQHFGLVSYVKVGSVEEVSDIIDAFIADFVQRPYKFNFLLPLNLHNLLSKQARNLHITKSELIRRLIEEYVKEIDK